MSGPYCKTCEHYSAYALTDEESGECLDPSKIIYAKCGDAIVEHIEVYATNECSNHEPSG